MDRVVHRCGWMESRDHEAVAVAAERQQAFDDLFMREREPMLRLAVLLVRSSHEAEEALQEAFAAVAARWESIERPGAYLRASVVNACRMILRRREVERRHATLDTAPPVEGPANLVELHGALSVLSDRERCAVALRYFADLPDSEIAELLGCRRSTVRSLVRRALAKLREELE